LAQNWLFLVLAIGANALGNIMLKVFSLKTADGALAAYLSPWFVAGNIFFFVNLIFYGKALRGLPQNIVYPVMVSGTILIVMAASALWFSERLSGAAILGAAYIVVGIALLAQGT